MFVAFWFLVSWATTLRRPFLFWVHHVDHFWKMIGKGDGQVGMKSPQVGNTLCADEWCKASHPQNVCWNSCPGSQLALSEKLASSHSCSLLGWWLQGCARVSLQGHIAPCRQTCRFDSYLGVEDEHSVLDHLSTDASDRTTLSILGARLEELQIVEFERQKAKRRSLYAVYLRHGIDPNAG